MAFDPSKTLLSYGETPCSVQVWSAETMSGEFNSLSEAVAFAKQHNGKWNDVEITVHLKREDIVYGSDKCHMMIDALERALKQAGASQRPAD
ncbi:MAG: hypothetical protein JWL86_4784 [Rhizobium sp.]|nr:hypothetical protein [Rhizobium sp.]